jgi:hypothetical protein
MALWTRLAILALPGLIACANKDDDDDDDADTSDDVGDDDDDDDDDDDGGDDGGADGVDWPEGDAGGCDLSGGSYILDLASARFVEPPGVGELLLGQMTSDLALHVTSVDGGTADAFMAFVEDGSQDPCELTMDLPPADWVDPILSLGPTDLGLDVGGATITLTDFTFAAAANDDCSGLRDGAFESELDMRVLAPVMEDLLGISDPDELCATMAGFGATCGPCGSDGVEYCINVAVDQIPAVGGSVDLVEVTEECR